MEFLGMMRFTNFPSHTICALSHWVSVDGESIGLDVNVSGTVIRVPGMVESLELGFVRRGRRQQVRVEHLLS